MSFFDDGEETATRAQRPAGPTPPRPRRPQSAGPGVDRHTLMVRRRVALGVSVVLLIVVVLLINGCLKSQKQQSLKEYNREVSQLALESNEQVAHPLFTELTNATSKSALEVETQVDQLRMVSQKLYEHAKGLSVPGEMSGAQTNLLLAYNLQLEGMTKLASLIPTALGGKSKVTSVPIAGAMETLLAADVIHSQRVVPLVQETLAGNGIHGIATSALSLLPNIGWLEPSTVLARMTGQASSSSQSGVAPGTHGSALIGVSVGTTTLEPEPTLNHISGGANQTFTVNVENTGTNNETEVKVDLTVTVSGKQLKASRVINQTEPGKKYNVEIPITGIPSGAAAKVEAYVEPVPGETNVENNKGAFLAIFGE